MIVLDASVIIAYLNKNDVHHERAREVLAKHIDDDFGANSLTLAEVLAGPAKHNQLEAARAALDDLEIQELPFGENTAATLAQLRASTRLKMPDCCVLLAAATHDAFLASFDDGLVRAAIARGIQPLT